MLKSAIFAVIVKHYIQEINLADLVRKRGGEVKLGEQIIPLNFSSLESDFLTHPAQFLIIGIPEDIGVRANYGRGGANTAFKPALESFLNQQANDFLNGNTIAVLGEIKTTDLQNQSEKLNPKNKTDLEELRRLTAVLDERVCAVVQLIIANNKTPIIIGGGHNNAYGNIKGSSLALGAKINVVNCDPHLDFRDTNEGRHSGNGFSYAFNESYLDKYSVFAMHEQYNNQYALNQFKHYAEQLYFSTYESIFVRESIDFKTALANNIGFVKNNFCGVELDLDAITNVPTSAKTSSGLSPIQARQFVYKCAKNLNAIYLHIAEGAPILSHIKADNKTGKLIAYLMSDFIKGKLNVE